MQHARSRFCEEVESDNDEMKPEDYGKIADDSKPTSSNKMDEDMISESDDDRDQKQLRADFIDHMEQRFLRGSFRYFNFRNNSTSCSCLEDLL